MLSDQLKNFNQFKTLYLGFRDYRDGLDEMNKACFDFFNDLLQKLRNTYPVLNKQLEYEELEEMLDESDHP